MLHSGHSGFRVEPERLRALAACYAGEAGQLAAAIPGFEGPAGQVQQAFGLLGPSDELYFEYLGLARDTVAGLHELRQALDQTADGLRATAQAYEEAEASSSFEGGDATA